MKSKLEEMVTLKEAAKLLRCSELSVRRKIELGRKSAGELGIWPAYRIGRILIPVSSLERYMGRVEA